MKLVNATLILLLVLATSAFAATHTVNQVGITFVPDDLTITAGDTVEWIWSSGAHTVTSGTDLADPNMGDFFDDPLTSVSTTVSFMFDTTGDFPYFCRPHVGLGMSGVVHVTPSVPNEESTWSGVKSLYR
jgi:plastocyanin